MFYPGFNVNEMSDEELLHTHQKLNAKLVWINNNSGNSDAIRQLQAMIAALESEKSERMFNKVHDNAGRDSVIVETDPALAGKEEKNSGNKKKTEEKRVISNPFVMTEKPEKD